MIEQLALAGRQNMLSSARFYSHMTDKYQSVDQRLLNRRQNEAKALRMTQNKSRAITEATVAQTVEQTLSVYLSWPRIGREREKINSEI